MSGPPPMWDPPPLPPMPHWSGPRANPAPHECGTCRWYTAAETSARQRGDGEAAEVYRRRRAGHQVRYPHRME
ncbi:hypothetical protein [Streptomyces huiliensis]|uniref:hypothetical protein n=1 Tax=Streptomyces huiliensis TaxID=2876027 RepID=UPI001CBC54BD|nr:hypothetical protein [Streptomyces huiliensis]MBZ4318770.1 hypothetical protein [Streptomyces huiliensis]